MSSDTSKAVARSARLRRNMLVSVVARVAGLVTPLLAVPLALSALGTADYGVWVTLSAAVSWLMLLDLGLNPCLRNRLAESFGRKDTRSAVESVSSVFLFTSAVAGVLAILSLVVIPLVPWGHVFNSGLSIPDEELRSTMAVVLGGFVLRFPLGVVSAIYQGYQEADRAALWDVAQAVASLAGLALVVSLGGGLLAVSIATTGANLAVAGVSAVHLFGWHKPWLRPTTKAWNLRVVREALSLGAHFTVIQVAAVVTYGTDSIVIAQVLGPTSVTTYSVVFRLFWLAMALQSLLLGPLWSAYTEAVASRDLGWVRKHLRRSVLASAIIGVPAIAFFVATGKTIIPLWTRTQIFVPDAILPLMGVYTALYLWQNCFAILLNGLGSVRLMSRLALVGAPMNLLLCVVLGRRMGLEGVVLANAITMLIGTVQNPWEVAFRLRKLEAAAC